jgi:hypothetical protein
MAWYSSQEPCPWWVRTGAGGQTAPGLRPVVLRKGRNRGKRWCCYLPVVRNMSNDGPYHASQNRGKHMTMNHLDGCVSQMSGAFPTAYDPVSRKAGRLPSTCHIGCIQKPVNTGAAHGRSPFWRYRQAFRIFVEKRTLSNKVCNGHNCRQSWQLHRTELFSASQAATGMADYCDAARSSEMVAPFL